MYPTKRQILRGPRPRFKFGVIMTVRTWKAAHFDGKWGSATPTEKLDKISELLFQLADLHEKPLRKVMGSGVSKYRRQVVYLDKPSIITALHELAHHLFGSSEVRACRWSVWLFKLCFPLQYRQLQWRGHMLVRDCHE